VVSIRAAACSSPAAAVAARPGTLRRPPRDAPHPRRPAARHRHPARFPVPPACGGPGCARRDHRAPGARRRDGAAPGGSAGVVPRGTTQQAILELRYSHADHMYVVADSVRMDLLRGQAGAGTPAGPETGN
jgi:hypothetical protein